MKNVYVITAILLGTILLGGCIDKSRKVTEHKVQVEVVEVANVQETKERVFSRVAPRNVIPKNVVPRNVVRRNVVRRNIIPRNETLVEEKKIIKRIASDVPTSCAMWSDGSNICTRVSRGKASCTANPVQNRMFSCLQWH